MEFRLPVPPINSGFSISHADHLLLLGSCFTDNIGQWLVRSGFSTAINPFGIVYNPYSIFRSLEYISSDKFYSEKDLDRNGEFFISFDHHGSFSDPDPGKCLEKINTELQNAQDHFRKMTLLFITLGTAFVYEWATDGRMVANCHKLPSGNFRKRLMNADAIVRHFEDIYPLLPSGSRIILTVSPVRHWKDGAAENTRSKSILITAIHELADKYENVSYFPAYELMLDDLRDYRFYASDMLHPNELAVRYIRERFSETYFTPETREIIKEVNALHQAMEHRPLFPDSAAYQTFQAELEARKTAFREKYPFIRL